MSVAVSDAGHESLLTSKGFRFDARRKGRGAPWHIIVGDKDVGFREESGIKSWAGVEIFARGAANQLYGVLA